MLLVVGEGHVLLRQRRPLVRDVVREIKREDAEAEQENADDVGEDALCWQESVRVPSETRKQNIARPASDLKHSQGPDRLLRDAQQRGRDRHAENRRAQVNVNGQESRSQTRRQSGVKESYETKNEL